MIVLTYFHVQLWLVTTQVYRVTRRGFEPILVRQSSQASDSTTGAVISDSNDVLTNNVQNISFENGIRNSTQKIRVSLCHAYSILFWWYDDDILICHGLFSWLYINVGIIDHD